MNTADNVKVCNENRIIVKNNYYLKDGKAVILPFNLENHQRVIVLDPKRVESIMNDDDELFEKCIWASEYCKFNVLNTDSFTPESDLVLNFANAVNPGGGYLFGASAQEEALCRQSTLYASIGSKAAMEMYSYNRMINSPIDSDYMLISPKVDVFRDAELNLLPNPFTTAVITAPAPNLNGRAKDMEQSVIDEVVTDRIRKMLMCAAYYAYRRITLGAWGCGAFGHNPEKMAGYFYNVLVDERYMEFFDEVTFAVLDKSYEKKNFTAFKNRFEDLII